jgi:reductive dehalogenase
MLNRLFKLTKSVDRPSNEYLNGRFDINEKFERFNQKNDIFNRSLWDEKVKAKDFFVSYDIANYKPKKSKGFDHWDYAFRNASWHLTDVVGEMKFEQTGKVEGFTDYYSVQTPPPSTKAPIENITECTKRIKLAAKHFGAGMVGVCQLDRRWVYSHNFNRKSEDSKPFDLPANLKYAIVLIIPMDYELSKTYPTALSGASTGLGYSVGLNAANTLAQFITNLGYQAVASLNDSTLSIPMAIEAGLGEYGRHGLLITPKFGPNIRIAKVFTDLPLEIDQPIEFGVQQFCKTCRKCADNCPVRAIPQGPPQSEPPNFSSLSGIRKWTVNAEKCFKFWVGMNTDCAICIRVCPYNKDYSKWWNRLGIRLANSPLRKLMLLLDDWLKFSRKVAAKTWWDRQKERLP